MSDTALLSEQLLGRSVRTAAHRGSRFWRKRSLAAIAGALVALAGGTAAIASAGGSAPPPTPSTGPMAFVPTTASSSQPIPAESALTQSLAALAGSDISAANVGPPPPDASAVTGNPAVPALYVSVKIPSLDNGLTVEPLWEADLLEGAVVEQSGNSPSLEDDVGDVYFSGVLPDGTVVSDIGGGMGNIARGQVFSGANDSDAAIERSIQQTVAAYGLTLDSVKIFHLGGAAPAVVVTAPDISKAAATYGSLVADLFGSPPRYQGYYIEIRGTDGKAYVRRSVSFVTGCGRLWLDPSVDGTGELPFH